MPIAAIDGPITINATTAEKHARLHCTEAAVVIDRILRTYTVCEDGRRVAWHSAPIIQRAIDAARER